MTVEFKAWGKITRGKGQVVTITEKLDGTNACIIIKEGKIIGVQSRTRLITPEDDNYGFAKWVYTNQEQLELLGDGYHYGEWYGEGIQKNHHKKDSKYLALFNTFRFHEKNPLPKGVNIEIVPILFIGALENVNIDDIMVNLTQASHIEEYIAEGVIIYYHNTKAFEKYTFKNVKGKWAKEGE